MSDDALAAAAEKISTISDALRTMAQAEEMGRRHALAGGERAGKLKYERHLNRRKAFDEAIDVVERVLAGACEHGVGPEAICTRCEREAVPPGMMEVGGELFTDAPPPDDTDMYCPTHGLRTRDGWSRMRVAGPDGGRTVPSCNATVDRTPGGVPLLCSAEVTPAEFLCANCGQLNSFGKTCGRCEHPRDEPLGTHERLKLVRRAVESVAVRPSNLPRDHALRWIGQILSAPSIDYSAEPPDPMPNDPLGALRNVASQLLTFADPPDEEPLKNLRAEIAYAGMDDALLHLREDILDFLADSDFKDKLRFAVNSERSSEFQATAEWNAEHGIRPVPPHAAPEDATVSAAEVLDTLERLRRLIEAGESLVGQMEHGSFDIEPFRDELARARVHVAVRSVEEAWLREDRILDYFARVFWAVEKVGEEGLIEGHEYTDDLAEAMALPPDLEAAIERRR